MVSITHAHLGIPVTDLDTAVDWYERLLGRPPDARMGDEVLWDLGEGCTVFVEPRPGHAGTGRLTLTVTGLDAALTELADRGVAHGRVVVYANGVRHVEVADPDGNGIAFAELPADG